METVLLFFLKQYDKKVNLQTKVSKMIKSLFPKTINDHEFRIMSTDLDPKWKPQTIIVSYELTRIDKMVMLKLLCEKETIPCILCVQKIVDQIRCGQHRKDLYITVAYDESSQCLCRTLYPMLSTFEKKLRRLIYELFIKTDGEKWVENTINQMPELANSVKSRIRGDRNTTQDGVLIEGAIDEFDYSQYSDLVRGTLCAGDFGRVWNEEFDQERLKNLNRQQIVEIIEQYRPRAFWDVAFADYDEMKGFDNTLDAIRATRNKVMHSKWLPYDEFVSAKNTLRIWNTRIQNVIDKLEQQTYTDSQKQFFGNYYSLAFKEYFENIEKLQSAIALPLSKYADTLASLKKVISEVVSNRVMSTLESSSWLDTFVNKAKAVQSSDPSLEEFEAYNSTNAAPTEIEDLTENDENDQTDENDDHTSEKNE